MRIRRSTQRKDDLATVAGSDAAGPLRSIGEFTFLSNADNLADLVNFDEGE